MVGAGAAVPVVYSEPAPFGSLLRSSLPLFTRLVRLLSDLPPRPWASQCLRICSVVAPPWALTKRRISSSPVISKEPRALPEALVALVVLGALALVALVVLGDLA